MAKRTMIFKLILIALISLISMCKCNPSLSRTTNTNGFTIDLIHRDSPESPSYDSSLSHSQRLANALRRSFARVDRFKTSRHKKSPESDIVNSNGEYLMKYSIGTPPIPSLAVADTGSDIIWTQCQPCTQCFKQKLPFFEPKNSSTYKKIPCNNPKCNSLRETSCNKSEGKNCLYSEVYGDGSFTRGELATDTITLESNDGKRVNSFPKITFGCGFDNGGIFDGGESGIVGLGGGNASLIRQLGPIAKGKFSYCLAPISDDNKSSSSKLNFGDNARVSGKGVVSSPLVLRENMSTFYFLTLDGISVGNQRLQFDGGNSSLDGPMTRGEGNIIIDSGTTLTLLPFVLYAKYTKAMDSYIKLKKIKDPVKVLSSCYFSKGDIKNIPSVTVHFRGGDVKWKYENVFIRTSNVSVCLAAQPVFDLAIYGNLAQVNFLVGYDLVKKTVSFKPTDCSKS